MEREKMIEALLWEVPAGMPEVNKIRLFDTFSVDDHQLLLDGKYIARWYLAEEICDGVDDGDWFIVKSYLKK